MLRWIKELSTATKATIHVAIIIVLFLLPLPILGAVYLIWALVWIIGKGANNDG